MTKCCHCWFPNCFFDRMCREFLWEPTQLWSQGWWRWSQVLENTKSWINRFRGFSGSLLCIDGWGWKQTKWLDIGGNISSGRFLFNLVCNWNVKEVIMGFFDSKAENLAVKLIYEFTGIAVVPKVCVPCESSLDHNWKGYWARLTSWSASWMRW